MAHGFGLWSDAFECNLHLVEYNEDHVIALDVNSYKVDALAEHTCLARALLVHFLPTFASTLACIPILVGSKPLAHDSV